MAFEHVSAILTAAGLSAEDVQAVNALPDGAADFDTASHVDKLKTGFETALKNDPNFWNGLDENNVNEGLRKKIEAGQFARATNIAKDKVMKVLGVTEADLADLSDDDKRKYETVITKAAEKYASTKAGDKQMQQDLINVRKQLEELQAALPEKETALKTQYETEFSNKALDFIVLAELAQVKGLTAPANYIADKIAAELKSNYTLKQNGLRADVFQKDKPELKVVEGTKELGLSDLIQKILVRDKLVSTTSEEDGKSGKVTLDVDGKNGEVKVQSHILNKIKEVSGK